MKLYAIRRRSDGAYLPSVNGKRGYTARAEPSTALPPRLFRRASDARACLQEWARGAQRMYQTGGFPGDDYDEELRVSPVVGRNVEDFDVVEVVLSLLRVAAGARKS